MHTAIELIIVNSTSLLVTAAVNNQIVIMTSCFRSFHRKSNLVVTKCVFSYDSLAYSSIGNV